MIAGTSSARIMVASKMIPAASPIPNCLMSTPGPVESTKNANMRTSAALVTSLIITGIPEMVASVACTPQIAWAPCPSWKMKTMMPNAAPSDARLRTTALSGRKTDRNARIRSRKVRRTTKARARA
jgi:hypothetical protein